MNAARRGQDINLKNYRLIYPKVDKLMNKVYKIKFKYEYKAGAQKGA